MKLSKVSETIQSSPIRKFIPYAQRAKERGIELFHLNIGQPDIKTPDEFFEAIRNYDVKTISYVNSVGIIELREEISKYYKRHDLDFSPEEIIVCNGGSEALFFVFAAICDEGDEIIVPEPFYTNYNSFAALSKVKMVPLKTEAKTGFHLPEKAELEKLITDRTRAILFSSPSNPTGTIYSKAELDMIRDVALKYDIFVIADEVYREFSYDGKAAISMASYEDLREHVILIDSISKRFSACGARVGNVATKNKDLLAALLKFAQSRLSSPILEQIGAVALYKMPPSYFEEILAEYEARRDVLYEGLMKIEGVKCKKPEGAFYIIIDLPVDNAEDFVIFLLEEFEDNKQSLMITPAEGFYMHKELGKSQVRIAYTLEVEKLKRCLELLEMGLKAYKLKD